MQKYPVKFAVDTSCALNVDSSNDFLNCCTRMSVRLFDIPHRKNSTVTSENSTICPAGNTGCFFLSLCDSAPAPIDVDTCIESNLQRTRTTSNQQPATSRPVYRTPPQSRTYERFRPHFFHYWPWHTMDFSQTVRHA